MARPLRIAFQIPFQPGAQSGGNLYDLRLAGALRELRHEVVIATSEIPEADVLIQDELLHGVPDGAGKTPRVAMVHHFGCDESEREAEERAALAASERAFLRGVQGILAPSRWSRDRALELRGSPVPAAVAAPGRDTLGGGPLPEDLPDGIEVARRTQQPGPLQVVFLGRLSRRKRVLELIEAARQVPECELTVCGSPDPSEPEVARHVFASGVRVRDHLEAGELPELLRSAHLLAGPSTHEGFGLIYLEAFAFGLPVIAAASGGAPDLVKHGENGWLVGPDEPPTRIAAHLRQAATDREMLTRMGKAALRRHREWPDGKASARVAERLLREVLRNPLTSATTDGPARRRGARRVPPGRTGNQRYLRRAATRRP